MRHVTKSCLHGTINRHIEIITALILGCLEMIRSYAATTQVGLSNTSRLLNSPLHLPAVAEDPRPYYESPATILPGRSVFEKTPPRTRPSRARETWPARRS